MSFLKSFLSVGGVALTFTSALAFADCPKIMGTFDCRSQDGEGFGRGVFKYKIENGIYTFEIPGLDTNTYVADSKHHTLEGADRQTTDYRAHCDQDSLVVTKTTFEEFNKWSSKVNVGTEKYTMPDPKTLELTRNSTTYSISDRPVSSNAVWKCSLVETK